MATRVRPTARPEPLRVWTKRPPFPAYGRQRASVEDLVGGEVGQRHLGGGDEPEPGRGLELVFREFGELRRAEHGLVAHQQRRARLAIAELARVEVQHELRQRPLELRELAVEHAEARAGELARPGEVPDPPPLADSDMVPG